jgi:catechol 2,3-dioxygenase-like lactoylglutathione lyase family enzyme
MLDHMTIRVSDIARTQAFYTAALAPLGYTLAYEGE